METTDITEQPIHEQPPGLNLNQEAKYFLHQSGRWASFLGVVGFIFTGLVVLMALFVGTIISILAKFQPGGAMPAGFGGFVTVLYLLFALFYFFFSFYLYQFGVKIKSGILFNNEIQVAAALGRLKSFFKMMGITTIVIIALYVLLIIGVIIAIPTLQKAGMGHNTLTYVK